MKEDKIKYIDIENRRFQILKYNAKTCLSVAKLVLSKALPAFDGINFSENIGEMLETLTESGGDVLTLSNISKALNQISDDDLDTIINKSLRNCYELLPAGSVQVLNPNSTYGVEGIEDDLLVMLRLTAETILWSFQGFFDGDRWKSIFGPMMDSSLPEQ